MEDEVIELSNPQYEFLTSTKKHTGFVAGFGSGKSFVGALKSLNKIINHDIYKTAYYLPTYGDIRDIAFEVFPEVAELLGYSYKLNKSDKEFTLFDGAEKIGSTIFRNMSEPESIVGYQVGYTLIDETDILREHIMDKAFKKILGRNRLVIEITDKEMLDNIESINEPDKKIEGTYWHKKKKMWCWTNHIDVVGTPEGFKWFYKRFKKNFNPNTDLLIKASTYSNMENLPEDYIETMKAEYTPELFRAYANGDFVNLTSGTIYYYFDRKENHTDREIISDDTRGIYDILYIGQDFNIGGCCGRVHVIDGDIPKLVEEYSVHDTQAIVNHLKKTYSKHRIIIYPDASGKSEKTNSSKSDIRLLVDAGFRVDTPSRNPFVQDRINSVNTLFYKKQYFINTHKCPESTHSLEQQAYDDNGSPEKFKGSNTIDDSNDACGYFIDRKFGLLRSSVKAYNKKHT